MTYKVGQVGVEYYDAKKDTLYACSVLKSYPSIDEYRFKVGGKMRVRGEQLCIRWSVLAKQRS